MDIHEAAKALDGNQYRNEGTPQLFEAMKADGLVAVFGYSDDGMEFRGAIDDEFGTGPIYLTWEGILTSECKRGEDCPYFKKLLKKALSIKAVDDSEGFTFTYETTIPHATFVIMEDDIPYCKGIVFALKDVASTA